MEIFSRFSRIIKSALAVLGLVLMLSSFSWAEQKPPRDIPPGARVLINVDENIVIETTVDQGLEHSLQNYRNEMAGVGFGEEGAKNAARIQKRMLEGFYNRAVHDSQPTQAIGLGALNGEVMIFVRSKSPVALARKQPDNEGYEDSVMFMLSELMVQADDVLAGKLRDRTYTALELARYGDRDEPVSVRSPLSAVSGLNTADDIILRMFSITE